MTSFNRIKIKLFFALVVLSAILFKSCSKDPLISESGYQTTPYTIPVRAWYPQLKLPSDNPLTVEGIQLGRMLFYDPVMSLDSSISCAFCHRQVFGFTDNLAVSKGIRNQLLTRNSMPLHNLMWNNKFFWDGRVNRLRDQVLLPIQAHNEMDLNLYDLVEKLKNSPRYNPLFKRAFEGKDPSPVLISKALEQFLLTMVSFNSKIDQLHGRSDTLNVITAQELRGLNLFMMPVENGGADCFHCHSNVPFFGKVSAEESMTNNGLDLVFTDKGLGNVTGNPTDNGKFKIPNLRNVEMTGPYMHDGRFATLEDVLDFYGGNVKVNSPNIDANMVHTVPVVLTEQQKQDIIAFLKTLTDQEFLSNPAFSNPF